MPPALAPAQARHRFTAARVARLATVDPAGRPHQVPVVFALLTDATGTDRVVTAVDHKPKTTHRLKRLANITAHPSVSLLVDAYDEDWDRLWWVRADGEARILPPVPADGAGAPDTAATGGTTTGATGEAPARERGTTTGALDPAVRRAYETAVAALCAKYPQYRERPPSGPVVAVTVRRWSGWEARP